MTATTVNTAGVSRRSIARGAAWAVPSVALAAAAPAVAASCSSEGVSETATMQDSASVTQGPGAAQWTITITLTNAGATAVPAGTALSYTLDSRSTDASARISVALADDAGGAVAATGGATRTGELTDDNDNVIGVRSATEETVTLARAVAAGESIVYAFVVTSSSSLDSTTLRRSTPASQVVQTTGADGCATTVTTVGYGYSQGGAYGD